MLAPQWLGLILSLFTATATTWVIATATRVAGGEEGDGEGGKGDGNGDEGSG